VRVPSDQILKKVMCLCCSV